MIPLNVYLVSLGIDRNTGMHSDVAAIQSNNEALGTIFFIVCIVMLVVCFIMIPWAYFYYEVMDEEEMTEADKHKKAGLGTVLFLIVIGVLILIGVFIENGQQTSDQPWIDNFLAELSAAENLLSFCMASLTVVGLICFVTYTAFGLARLPVQILKSRPLPPDVPADLDKQKEENLAKKERLQKKYGNKKLSKWTKFDKEKWGTLIRNDHKFELWDSIQQPSCWDKIWNSVSWIRIIVGSVLLLISVFIVVGLFLGVLDQTLNSTCGVGCGFAIPSHTLPNPIDLMLSGASRYFPLDLLLYGGLVFWIFICTVSGLIQIGVRIFCLKLYNIKRSRTMANGLLMGIWMLILSVLAVNVQMVNLAPLYTNFGDQFYVQQYTLAPVNTTVGVVLHQAEGYAVLASTPAPTTAAPTTAAPTTLPVSLTTTVTTLESQKIHCQRGDENKHTTNQFCIMSKISQFLSSTLIKLPVFGLLFWGANWLFIAIFLMTVVYSAFIEKSIDVDYSLLLQDEEEEQLESVFD